MFPTGLSMLWEDTDPTSALADRFGLASFADAQAWVSTVLGQRWGLAGVGVDRLLISDRNAIAWVRTDEAAVIVKIASWPGAFARLGAIADLSVELAGRGIPIPTPIRADGGAARVIVDHDGRPLSALLQPQVRGEHLDVRDLAAVGTTGAELARLHQVMAGLPAGPLHVPGRGADRPLRERLATVLRRPAGSPSAHERLATLLASLPDIDAPPQLTHGDIRSANVLIDDQRVAAILDLDEVGLDHRVAELGRAAVLLATQFRDWGPTPPDAQRALVDGYRCVVELSEIELGWLQASILATSLAMIPTGPDPTGWAAAAERDPLSS